MDLWNRKRPLYQLSHTTALYASMLPPSLFLGYTKKLLSQFRYLRDLYDSSSLPAFTYLGVIKPKPWSTNIFRPISGHLLSPRQQDSNPQSLCQHDVINNATWLVKIAKSHRTSNQSVLFRPSIVMLFSNLFTTLDPRPWKLSNSSKNVSKEFNVVSFQSNFFTI